MSCTGKVLVFYTIIKTTTVLKLFKNYNSNPLFPTRKNV